MQPREPEYKEEDGLQSQTEVFNYLTKIHQVPPVLRVHTLASNARQADPGKWLGLLRQGHGLPSGD